MEDKIKEGPKHKLLVYEGYNLSKLDLNDPNSKSERVVGHDIDHPVECDALKYGQECWLDAYLMGCGSDELPTEPGRYEVWMCSEWGYVNNWSHCGYEYEEYPVWELIDSLDSEPID